MNRLPYLFHLAELESSRAGKIGMEVGSLRERIIVALLIYKFGEDNVISNIPITESEVDVILYDKPVSIKTLTSKGWGGVKLIWTVDALKAIEFRDTYNPHCDMLLIQLNWNNLGVFCYIPFEVQVQIFESIGRNNYIKLPKEGTNPRGVEITQDALLKLVKHEESKNIEIFWQKTKIDNDPFKRWIDYWKEDLFENKSE
jgi:hypothetical protein